jgi:hypothetical protein
MRGARSYLITGAYVLVVMLFVLTAYWMLASGDNGPMGASRVRAPGGGSPSLNQQAAEVGRGIWMWGCIAQGFLLPLLVPAFTCGAITLERERDLLELLLLTRQSAFQICLGKLGSGVGLGLTLVLSSVPVLALSALLGGVAPSEMLATLAVLVSAVIAAGSLGLAASALAPRTTAATAWVYLIVGTGLIGMPLVLYILGAARQMSEGGSEWGILAMLAACMLVAFPPAVGLAVLLSVSRRRRTGHRPDRAWWMLTTGLCWSALLLVLYLPGVSDILLQGNAMVLLHPVAAIAGVMVPQGARPDPLFGNLWWICTFAYLGASVWFFYTASLRVQRLRM